MTNQGSVLVFVGTRADLGPLIPVVTALAAAPDLTPVLVTGVAFDTPELAAALPPNLSEVAIHALSPRLTHWQPDDLIAHGTAMAAALGVLVSSHDFAAAVVLGDRWELLYVVPALVLAAVPVVHLHGGEVTEGALDDRIRHAVTKLADVHCVASPASARRLRQMGEPSERILVTGAPGLDRYVDVAPVPLDELAAVLDHPLTRPLVLFTYHPVTAGEATPDVVATHARQALQAALATGGTVIATYPGMDAGREELLAVLEEFRHHGRVVLVPGLGTLYPAVLASSDAVVGNSSSGVIEAAAVGVPAVNIGIRQLGREAGPNVNHCADGYEPVRQALVDALTAERSPRWRADNPYGDGHAADRITHAVRLTRQTARQKPFIDVDCHDL